MQDIVAARGGQPMIARASCGFPAAQVTAVLGPAGAGKTALLDLLSGQLRPVSGRMIFLGRDITRVSVAARARRGIGRGFQRISLFDGLSVRENVRIAARMQAGKAGRMLRGADANRRVRGAAEAVLGRVRLAQIEHRRAADLSALERRLLDLAVLMAMDPRVYLIDDPVAGVADADAQTVLDVVAGLGGQAGRCVIVTGRNPAQLRPLADRCAVLVRGHLVAEGGMDHVAGLDVMRGAGAGQDLMDV